VDDDPRVDGERHGVSEQPNAHVAVQFGRCAGPHGHRAERDRRTRESRQNAAAHLRGVRAAMDRVERDGGHRDQVSRGLPSREKSERHDAYLQLRCYRLVP